MFVSRSVTRVALRRGCNAVRHFSSSRPVAVAYHSYGLPSNLSSPPPRADDVPETSIAQPDHLPKVHETRPPPQQQQQLRQRQEAAPTPPAAPAATSQPPAAPAPKIVEKEAQKTKAARPRSKLRARKAAMKLTPSAVEQLRTLLDSPEPKLIKVGVRNRGCSGLAYHLEYVDKPGTFDETVEQDGVKVLIDSKALFSIIGSEMDWTEDKLNQRFVFRNPNIKEECGCGESFMV
ncbi:Iron-sulfur assembly protein 1 [Neonectria punicea]|uniref:Iron-sulfur assembly protein 1 n=1 Tax=Neonectria punicea TaxID=979145 RepID=A0ABR1H591_9HYPO